jgi:hypothetical protein
MDRVRLTSFGVYRAGRFGGLEVICPAPTKVKEVICVNDKFAITLCYKISGAKQEIKFPVTFLHDLDNVRALLTRFHVSMTVQNTFKTISCFLLMV